MKISIIIPSRNREFYLCDLLDDLDKQTLPADEIIVIDQSDVPYAGLSCTQIIDEGVGPCRARNIGLAAASGDIFVFLDDDVRINEEFLEIITTPILNNESKVVVGAICDEAGRYRNESYLYWRKQSKNWLLALTANPDFPGESLTLSFPAGCAAIHRSVYEKIGGFDIFFDPDGAGEDREYALRVYHAGYPILYKGNAKVNHLGISTGGRRSNQIKTLPPLELNCLYIIGKYFNQDIFADYSKNWAKTVFKRHITLNPQSWLYGIKDWLVAKQWITHVANYLQSSRSDSA